MALRLVSWSFCVAILLMIEVAAQPAVVAIRNVTVIPATSGSAAPITGATVVITGDRITAIGPAASTVIPKQARIVDGSGKFLMPGLIDMHAHPSKARASSLGLFVANGVTTIRDPEFGGGTVVAEVGDKLWVGTFRGNRIAILPAP